MKLASGLAWLAKLICSAVTGMDRAGDAKRTHADRCLEGTRPIKSSLPSVCWVLTARQTSANVHVNAGADRQVAQPSKARW